MPGGLVTALLKSSTCKLLTLQPGVLVPIRQYSLDHQLTKACGLYQQLQAAVRDRSAADAANNSLRMVVHDRYNCGSSLLHSGVDILHLSP